MARNRKDALQSASRLLISLAVGAATCVVCLAETPEPGKPALTESSAVLSEDFGEGLEFNFLKKKLQLKVGSYFFFDYGNVHQPHLFDVLYGDAGSDAEVRAARLRLDAKLFRSIHLKFEITLEDSDFEISDAYFTRSGIPYLGELRIGQVKEPFGMETLQSSRHTLFMERSLLSAFTPGRNIGIKFSNAHLDNRLTWSAGLFRDTNTLDSLNDSDGIGAVARVTGLPLLNEARNERLHVGLSLTHRINMDEVSRKVRPESDIAPRYLDTGTYTIDGQDAIGVELAYQRGPFLAQGEYVHMWLRDVEYPIQFTPDIDTPILDAIAANPVVALTTAITGRSLPSPTFTYTAKRDLEFSAIYGQLSYVLTGESREYIAERGIFGTVTPKRNFRLKGLRGLGAWEVGARISHIDLDDGFISGGKETNFTLGLNWYLNRSVRLMFNYIHAEIETKRLIDLPDFSSPVYLDDDVDIFQMRLQFNFAPDDITSLVPHNLFRPSNSKNVTKE